jgi:transcriptional regulator
MSDTRTELLRGTLDLLILQAVALEPLHGVGISRRIGQMTKGTFSVSFGSLFPSLHRMEERGWLAAEWRSSENNRRAKYYRMTRAGERQLGVERHEWLRSCTRWRRRWPPGASNNDDGKAAGERHPGLRRHHHTKGTSLYRTL